MPGEVPSHPPTTDFTKLCKDFTILVGKPYVGTEPYVNSKSWIYICEAIFGLMGLGDNVRR